MGQGWGFKWFYLSRSRGCLSIHRKTGTRPPRGEVRGNVEEGKGLGVSDGDIILPLSLISLHNVFRAKV